MADTGQPKLVRAIYNFKGANNDELCCSKGDLITVTQVLDGGWWEGTLKGLTGWFPSNYVKECQPDNHGGATSPLAISNDVTVNKRESVFYHNVVLQSLIDSERTLVCELQKLIQTYLRPLHTATVLSAVDYNCLVGNLEDIAALHNTLLTSLDECSKLPMDQQRIGGLFLETASPLKNMYESYCANHPHAASILANKKDDLQEFMESKGTTVMKFTSSLSKPFTRLDKYPNLLKELHRHTDEGHVDRGDTQRAISVYRDIALHCNEVRKQKQMEFEILSSPIQGWEGQDVRDLGPVLHMSFARIHSENGETKERIVLLFPGLLVMLSISPRMSGYLFEGKFPVSGMIVESIEDSEVDLIKHAFQISGSLIDRRVVCCNSNSQKLAWIDAIRQEAKHGPSHPPTKPQTLPISSSSQPSVSTLSKAKTARVYNDNMHSSPAQKMTWSLSCLRPSPPIRPNLTAREDLAKSPKISRKTSFRKKPERAHSEDDYYYYKRNDARYLEDDSDLLKVIEAYCSSTKARQTVNSLLFKPDAPHVIIAEDEKIIIESQKGNEIVVEEKSLVDTVYSLREEIKDVKSEMKKLSHNLEEERRARKILEKMFKKFTIASRASQPLVAAASGMTYSGMTYSGMTSSGMTSSGMSLSSTSGMSSSIGASGLINSILDAKLEEGLSA